MADKNEEEQPVIHVHYVHHFHHAATPQQYYIMGPPPMHGQSAPGAQGEFIMGAMAPGFFASHYQPPKADRDEDE